MPRYLFILYLLLGMQGILRAQFGEDDSSKIFQYEISYIGDIFSNLSGGIRKGSTYLGIANIRLGFSTKAAHLWKGGFLFVNGANTHGGEPSAFYLGDLQVASNIEAGNHTFMQEMWYRQWWRFGEITLGLQDLNIDFANSSSGGLFLNSSFGILPTVSGNVPAPIFPLTSLGISTKWKLSAKYSLLAAIYDGSATDFNENPHNLSWDLGIGEGVLIFTELQRKVTLGSLPGTYKAGIYLHQHFGPEEDDHDDDVDTSFRNNNGLYIIYDQMLRKDPGNERNLSAFLQLGLGPKRFNTNYFYFGLGLNYTGIFTQHGNDVAGVAIAHDVLRGRIGYETTVELTYRYTIFHFLYLQPNIQYIIHPAGTGEQLDNCLAVTLRFEISL